MEYLEVVGDVLPFLIQVDKSKIIRSGLLDFWIDLCSREAENDSKIQSGEKLIALAILSDIWLLFTEFVDSKDDMANTLLFVLKRAVRERNKSIRLTSIAYLFKILDKLSQQKNKSAPMIYKTLIFSLIENPNEPSIREMYLTNFKELFTTNKTIPIALLMEPYIRQITSQLSVTFQFKNFDFDFFTFIIKHQKLSASIGSQIVALFSTLVMSDLSFSAIAQEIILTLLKRFLVTPEKSDDQIMSQVESLIKQSLTILLDLEPISRSQA